MDKLKANTTLGDLPPHWEADIKAAKDAENDMEKKMPHNVNLLDIYIDEKWGHRMGKLMNDFG